MAFRLGVDFGTSNTVAFLEWPDGRVQPLMFDGSPLLPSGVCLDGAGGLAVGNDALANAEIWPHRYEPSPKRHIIEQAMLLGEREVPVTELVAAVLRRVASEAESVAGEPPSEVVCTCPASWGSARRGVLAQAVASAGLGTALLIEEPSAAAAVFAAERKVPLGSPLLVYDLGAGTFDASLVRRTDGGFEVIATEGLDDIGGLDIDAAIIAHLAQACAARDPGAWEPLRTSNESAHLRARLRFWSNVRTAKHMLSRSAQAWIHVPLVDRDVLLTREELDQLAAPTVNRTVAATGLLLRSSGLSAADAAGVFLVGGASRMPLVASLLHRGLGIAPIVGEQPDLVVAQGALLSSGAPARQQRQSGAAEIPLSAPAPAPPAADDEVPASHAEPGPPALAAWAGRHRRALAAGLAFLLFVLVGAVAMATMKGSPPGRTGAGDRGGGAMRTDGAGELADASAPAPGSSSASPTPSPSGPRSSSSRRGTTSPTAAPSPTKVIPPSTNCVTTSLTLTQDELPDALCIHLDATLTITGVLKMWGMLPAGYMSCEGPQADGLNPVTVQCVAVKVGLTQFFLHPDAVTTTIRVVA